MKTLYSILWMAGLCLSLLACGEDDEPVIGGEPDVPTGIDFHLTVEDEDGAVPQGDAHWLVFGEDDCLAEYVHNASVEELCDTYRPATSGRYLYILVVNPGDISFPDRLPEGMPVADAFRMLESLKEAHPTMLSGWVRAAVEEDSLNNCTLRVREELAQPSTLRLFLRFPQEMTNRSRSVTHTFRCVVEAYDKDSGQCVLHRALFPTVGIQTCEVTLEYLEQRAYDLLFWCDYVSGSEPDEDLYYLTSSLRAVTINDSVPYVAGSTGRRAFYLHTEAKLDKPGVTEKTATLESPFASYSLTCSDVRKYEEMQGVNDLPVWEDIEVQGVYEGYFPCAFDVWNGVPSDAHTGQTFTARITRTAEGEVILFNDYIFASRNDASFTSVSFTLVDKRTGKVFSQVDDILVDYAFGEETMVSGNYLTAGVFSDNVNVDDRWDGEIDINF